jgi:hypothetical protein
VGRVERSETHRLGKIVVAEDQAAISRRAGR